MLQGLSLGPAEQQHQPEQEKSKGPPPATHRVSGQGMTGTVLMLFFGLPSSTRSL